MKTFDNEKYGRIMEMIEFGISHYRSCIDDAFEQCDNVDDVIDYILEYYEDYLFYDDRSAISWLKTNMGLVDFYMSRGDLSGCTSIWELAYEAHYVDAKEKLLTVKDEIQQVIDLYRQSDDDDDDDDDGDDDDGDDDDGDEY